MRAARLVLLLVAASSALAATTNQAPWFCHELDCPSFTLVHNHTELGGVELRRYDAGMWASTVVAGVKYDKAVATGFWRLFKYISGNNVPQQKVEMTAPVTVKVTPAQGPFCEDNFTVSFFVPFAFQASPPPPSDAAVFIEERPGLEVFVKAFPGWATGSTYLQEAADLTQKLESAGLPISTEHFFTAGYDSPFRLRGRHNEVWIPKHTSAPSAAASPTAGAAAGAPGDGSFAWLAQLLGRRAAPSFSSRPAVAMA